MAGLTTILAGDERFFNNIFVGKGENTDKSSKLKYGTEGYDNAKLPVWMSGNLFYNGARPSEYEKNFIDSPSYDPAVNLSEDGENVYLQFNPDQLYNRQKGDLITSDLLGFAKIPKARFENTDGTSLVFDKDYFGRSRSPQNVLAGPFSEYVKEKEILKIW
jgi:hypothetical protein